MTPELDIRRAFTVFQLTTIQEEARHSLIIVEHDPLLYEDAGVFYSARAQVYNQAYHKAHPRPEKRQDILEASS